MTLDFSDPLRTQPEGEGEIALAAGDEIDVTSKEWEGDEDWWVGVNQRSGETGAFPATFVCEPGDEPPPEQDLVKALDDFTGEEEGELSLVAGDVIEVTSREVDGDTQCVPACVYLLLLLLHTHTHWFSLFLSPHFDQVVERRECADRRKRHLPRELHGWSGGRRRWATSSVVRYLHLH